MVMLEKVEKPVGKRYIELNNMLNIPNKDGSIQLDKDKEAVHSYFLDEINQNTVFFHTLREKIDYLIENKYIEEWFIDLYTFEFIKELFQEVYDYKHRFSSFMGAYKFYSQYAMKTDDGTRYLERYEDRIAFTALYLAKGNTEFAMDLAIEMITGRYQPATPTFMNAGKVRAGRFISCFLIDFDDDMLSIGRGINSVLNLSKNGGGIGVNLSNLRESGAPIKGIPNSSSGVVPVMKILEDSLSYSNQMGARNGAGAVYLSVFHPDIYAFLSTKKENADEKVRVKTLSLGVTIPDKYYELLKTNEPMYLFSPYDVEREYGVPFSYVDITNEYDNLVHNEKITKYKTNAREMEQEISKLQQESGYPYVVNIDTANKENPVHGKILMSNLCSEILQVQKPSKINEDLSYDEIGLDISCNLGSSNIYKMLHSEDFEKSVDVAIRSLMSVSTLTSIEEVPTVKKANELYRSVGYGAMNLAGTFARYKIEYGSPESIEFTDKYFEAMRFYSLKTNNEVAKETGKIFYEFDKSKYADGSFIDERYINKEDSGIQYEIVKEMLKNVPLPTKEDWEELNKSIVEYGLYSSYTNAIAPTGSISYINESTSSIHPIVNKVEQRQEGKVGLVYYPAPGMNSETIKYFKSAYDIDMRKVIDIYAAAQKHIDQGMSLTLFLRSEIPEGLYEWKGMKRELTTRDLNKLRNYAWTKGIKSIYYIRQHTGDNGGEVGINECESCTI